MFKQKGGLGLFTAIIVPVSIMSLILITNSISIFVTKHELKNRAELAALAGAAQLGIKNSNNVIRSTKKFLKSTTNKLDNIKVSLGIWSDNKFTQKSNQANAVRVIASKNLSLADQTIYVVNATSIAVKKPLIIGSYIVH